MTKAYTRQQYTWREVTLELSAAEELRQIESAGDYIRVDEASDPSAHVFVRVGDPHGPRRKMRLSAEIDGAEFGALFLDWPAQPRDGGTFAWVRLLIATTHGQVRFGSPDPLEIDLTGIVAVEQGLITSNGTRRRDSRTWLDLYLQPEPGFTEQTLGFLDVIDSDVASIDPGTSRNDGHWDPVNRVFLIKNDDTWREFDEDWNAVATYAAPHDGGWDSEVFAFDGDDVNNIFHMNANDQSLYYANRYSGSVGTRVAQSNTSEHPNEHEFDPIEDGLVAVGGFLFYCDQNGMFFTALEDVRVGSPSWTLMLTRQQIRDAPGAHSSMQLGAMAELAGGRIMITERGRPRYVLVDANTGAILKAGESSGDQADNVLARGGILYTFADDPTSTVQSLWPGYDDDTTITMAGVAYPGACRGSARIVRAASPIWTTARVNATSLGDGRYGIGGELIRLALAWYAGAWDAVPADYLDHVYGIRVGEPGREDPIVVSNAQTFAAAGIADRFSATIPERISVQVDRQLFA